MILMKDKANSIDILAKQIHNKKEKLINLLEALSDSQNANLTKLNSQSQLFQQSYQPKEFLESLSQNSKSDDVMKREIFMINKQTQNNRLNIEKPSKLKESLS